MKGRGDAPERGVVAPVNDPECIYVSNGRTGLSTIDRGVFEEL